MSDNNAFGFAKLVPGFDFLQNLAKGAADRVPQLPNLSNWVAPTLNVEELDKRISELKSVQFWLEQNSRALAATVQALEVQKMTLATLQGMNFSMGDVANAFKLKAADTVASGVQKAGETAAGAAQAMAGAARAAAEAVPDAAAKAAKGAADALADRSAAVVGRLDHPVPADCWRSAQGCRRQSALDTTRNVATGLAKEAFKTASDMATQFAAKGVQSMQEAAGVKPAAPAKKAPAKKAAKPAAKPAAKAAKPAAKAAAKAPARRPARKSAG